MKEDDTITTKTTKLNNEIGQHDILSDEDPKTCPVCNSTERFVDNSRAEVCCARCGLVLDENLIDHGPEWRAFDHEQRDKRTRTGAPLTYTISDKGLNTTIDWKDKDIHGHKIPERNKAQIYRLRKWNKRMRVSGAGERNLAFALSELDRDSSRLGIPRSVREDAAIIYREIAIASNVSKKQVGKTYRFLSRELNIKLKPTSPSDYISRFASKLGLSGEVQAKAIEIINKAVKAGLSSGKGPTGVAAAALYIASLLLGERKTQKEVSEISGVTEVTIRNRYKELSENIDMVV